MSHDTTGENTANLPSPDEFSFVISASAMQSIVSEHASVDIRYGMIDSGSNIQLATHAFANQSGKPEIHRRSVGTAEHQGSLPIVGWIDVGGYIGLMAVCEGAAFTLISVSICQSRGL